MPAASARPVLVITAPFDATTAVALKDAFDVRVIEPSLAGRSLADAELEVELAQAAALVCELDTLDERTLALAPELRLVVSCRANPVNVDLAACTRRGVLVATTPARNAEVTADLAFALLLDTVRGTGRAERWLRAGNWSPQDTFAPYRQFRGIALSGRTLGLLGGGAIGRRVLGRALGFGMHVLVYDPYLEPGDLGEDAELVSLDELLRRSDAVSVHVPLNEATKGLIGARELSLLRPDAYLINCARAAVIDEAALVAALAAGRLAGAGLDVFWTEPIPADHPLLALNNVTLTPHIGGASDDVIVEQTRIAERALRAWSAGRAPEALANPEVLGAGPSV